MSEIFTWKEYDYCVLVGGNITNFNRDSDRRRTKWDKDHDEPITFQTDKNEDYAEIPPTPDTARRPKTRQD